MEQYFAKLQSARNLAAHSWDVVDHMQLDRPVRAENNVENWLGSLLRMVGQSVHAVIRNAAIAIGEPDFDLMNFLQSYPAQVCLTCHGKLYILIVAEDQLY